MSNGTESLTQKKAEKLKGKADISAVLNTYDVEKLLKTPGAEGIRFYHALLSNGNDSIIAIAAGKKSLDGKLEDPNLVDLHKGSTYYYYRSDGNDLGKQATRMRKSTAIDYLKYDQDSSDKYHVFFSKESLESILAKENVDGIRFYDAPHDGDKSMMMVGAKDTGNGGTVDNSGNGEHLLSGKKCPPYCPVNGGKALFSA